MFEFGRHNVNGVHFEGLPADNFERVLPRSGWRIDDLGTTTSYRANLSSEALANMPRLSGRQDIADRMAPLQDQSRDRVVAGKSLDSHAVLGCQLTAPDCASLRCDPGCRRRTRGW
jgi:hypothetical protein